MNVFMFSERTGAFMVTVGASGREVSLTAGDYRARIVTVGAGLAGLTYRGHELIIPHTRGRVSPRLPGQGAHALAESHRRRHLFVEGTSYDLPVNEHAFGTSLHGFVAFQEWEIAEADTSSVLLRTLIPARYSYPWTLVASARYSLDPERGLAVELSATNIGEGTAPYGVGSIPTWLSTVYGWMIWSLRIPRRLSTRPTLHDPGRPPRRRFLRP